MIREATALDVLPALELSEHYAAEAEEYAGLTYDPEVAVQNFMYAVDSDLHLFILSITGDGKVAGMLWATCSPFQMWSSDWIATDQIVYVKPDYRGTSHGMALIKHYERWAKELGASEVRLSIASGIHEDKTGELYKKIGYSHLGTIYRRKL